MKERKNQSCKSQANPRVKVDDDQLALLKSKSAFFFKFPADNAS